MAHVNRSKTVDFRFFDMCTTIGEDCSKAQTLFDAIDQAQKSLEVDNTNTNVGEHNSINSTALKENKSIFIVGCHCHLDQVQGEQGGCSVRREQWQFVPATF